MYTQVGDDVWSLADDYIPHHALGKEAVALHNTESSSSFMATPLWLSRAFEEEEKEEEEDDDEEEKPRHSVGMLDKGVGCCLMQPVCRPAQAHKDSPA